MPDMVSNTPLVGFRYTPAPTATTPTSDRDRAIALGINVNQSGWLDQLRAREASSNNQGTSGNPQTPAPAYQQLNDIVSGLDITPPTAEEEAQMREQARRQMQAYIDSLNASFDSQVASENVAGQGRLGSTRAVNARSGTIGQDFGNAAMGRTQEFNKQQIAAIENRRQQAISLAEQQIYDRAQAQIDAAKEEARGNRELYMNYLNQQATEAKQNFKDLAAAGVNIEDMNPEAWNDLISQTGYDPQTAEFYFNALKPKEEQISYQYVNQADGSILAIGQDPKTGQVVTKRIESGVDPAFGLVLDMASKYQDAGILPTDSLDVATEKIKSSGIYKASIRPPSSGGSVSERLLAGQQNIINDATNALEAERQNSTDGKANPDTYRKFKSQYIASGGSVSDFFQAVPLEVYISAANRKGDLSGTSSEIKTTQQQISEEEAQNLVNKYDIQSVEDLNSKVGKIDPLDYQKLIDYLSQ